MPGYVETKVDEPIQTSAGVPLEGRGLFMTGAEGTMDDYSSLTRVQTGTGRRTKKHSQRGKGRGKKTEKKSKHSNKKKRSGKTPRKPRGKKHHRTHRRRYAVQSGRGYGFAPLEGDNIGSQGAARADIVPVSTCENVATNP
jgi:hypothetical protein